MQSFLIVTLICQYTLSYESACNHGDFPKDTGGTCYIWGCNESRGETNCVSGRCICKKEFYAKGGRCVPCPTPPPIPTNRPHGEITVLNANIYGLPTSTILNHQEFRFIRLGEAICNMTSSPDVLVFQEMNAAFYGFTQGNNFMDYGFPPDEHINNVFRKIIHDCGYKYQKYYFDWNDTKRDFEEKKCQLYENCENGLERKIDDWTNGGCGFLGMQACKWCCHPSDSVYNHGENSEVFSAMAMAKKGLQGKKVFRSGIMIASKYEFEKDGFQAYQEFSGIGEVSSIVQDGLGSMVDNIKSSIGQMAEKGIVMAKINKDGLQCSIYGTHLNAYNTGHAMEERKQQLKELKDYIQQNSNAAQECIIVAGDMNIDHYGPESEIFSQYLHIDANAYPPNEYYTVHGDPDDSELYNPLAHAETTKTEGFYDFVDKRKRYYDYVFSVGVKPSIVHRQRVLFRSAKPYVFVDKRKEPPNNEYEVLNKQKEVYTLDGVVTDFLTDHDSLLATFTFDQGKPQSTQTSHHWETAFVNVKSQCWNASSDLVNYGFNHNDRATQILEEGNSKYTSPEMMLDMDKPCEEDLSERILFDI